MLLLIANLFPAYWYFSFIALLPFLWRIREASPQKGWRLGLLLGLTFWVFSSLDVIAVTFWATSVKIVCGTILFALWGWIVGLARRRLGFNPVIVAGLWVFFELALVKLGYTTGLLAHSFPSNSFVIKVATLFGFGVISFLITLLNSLLVRAIEYAARILAAAKFNFSAKKTLERIVDKHIFSKQQSYLVSEERGPP